MPVFPRPESLVQYNGITTKQHTNTVVAAGQSNILVIACEKLI